MVRIARMALSKAGLELGAVAALAAVMLGAFYHQGMRVDASEERLSARIDGLDERLNERIDGLDERINERIDDLDERINKRIDVLDERIDGLDERIDGLDRRLARIEGLLEALASTQSPGESDDGTLG